MQRFRGLALTLALTLGGLPTVSVLCCAWGMANASEPTRPSCHQDASSSGEASLQAIHDCAPAALAPTSVADGHRRMLAGPVSSEATVTTVSVTPALFIGRRPSPVPILHVPKHLLYAVLII